MMPRRGLRQGLANSNITDYRCAKCGVRTLALLWNAARQLWFCHSCFLSSSRRYSKRTAYWAEEYDEPIGGRKPTPSPLDARFRIPHRQRRTVRR